MNSNGSGGRLEEFFAGRGFYIVLFLCAAVIGVSAWMMAGGELKGAEDPSVRSGAADNHRVETVVIPPQETMPLLETGEETETVEAPAEEAAAEPAAAEPEETEPLAPASGPLVVWPVEGELERGHSSEQLRYDVTMRDWRTHAGVDILAPLGTPVAAAWAGTVESVVSDDLYGTVVTVSHGDGRRSVYANLADVPAVSAGDWVEPGTVIGAVGTTALCEVGQQTHLHFGVTVNGEDVDPMDYLPA